VPARFSKPQLRQGISLLPPKISFKRKLSEAARERLSQKCVAVNPDESKYMYVGEFRCRKMF
jgi:hypothetical protein